MKPLHVANSIVLELVYTFILGLAIVFPANANVFLTVACIIAFIFVITYKIIIYGIDNPTFMGGIVPELKSKFVVKEEKFSFLEIFNISLMMFMITTVAHVVPTTYITMYVSIPLTTALLSAYTVGRLILMTQLRKVYEYLRG